MTIDCECAYCSGRISTPKSREVTAQIDPRDIAEYGICAGERCMKVTIKPGYRQWYQTLIDTEGAKDLGITDGTRVMLIKTAENGDVHVRFPDGPLGSVDAWIPERFIERSARQRGEAARRARRLELQDRHYD